MARELRTVSPDSLCVALAVSSWFVRFSTSSALASRQMVSRGCASLLSCSRDAVCFCLTRVVLRDFLPCVLLRFRVRLEDRRETLAATTRGEISR